jgi:polygalacturonase
VDGASSGRWSGHAVQTNNAANCHQPLGAQQLSSNLVVRDVIEPGDYAASSLPDRHGSSRRIAEDKLKNSTMNRRSMLKSATAAVAALAIQRGMAAVLPGRYDVRSFGAKGDGKTVDTLSIQQAIQAAARAGGGTVFFPAGTYLCFSLKLRSRVALELGAGVTLLAGTPDFADPAAQYDGPEPQPASIVPYQDFGHNHWHNSLLYGEDLDQVTIAGDGLLWGRGLNKGDGPNEERPGVGNKIIALKNCRNVLLRDLSLRDAGHFGVLASGVDNLTIDNLRIDTRRDGIDIDSCRNVHISNCTVNAPWDDAIVLKSSYSLGALRSTEQVTINGCTVTGSYQMGSLLDATFLPFPSVIKNDRPSLVGRIKIGTETNGDVRNVVVSNCVFEGCHGIAVESEDGGHVTDVSFSNITMRNLLGPPFFVRLGSRLRGPAGTVIGTVERIAFDSIDCWNATSTECSILSGVPGHPIRDVSFHNIRIEDQGGGTRRKGELPEAEKEYPDPQMFGETPAQGFYIRHVMGLQMNDVQISAAARDARPLLVLDDVEQAHLDSVQASGFAEPAAVGRRLTDVSIRNNDGAAQSIGTYQP